MRRSSLLFAAVVLAAVASGCVLDGPKNEPRITNESGVAVMVFWTGSQDDDVYYADIPPRRVISVYEVVGSCASSNMVAKTADGRELVRTEKPLCPGDSWVIGPSDRASPS